jgi:hypothetical protein
MKPLFGLLYKIIYFLHYYITYLTLSCEYDKVDKYFVRSTFGLYFSRDWKESLDQMIINSAL